MIQDSFLKSFRETKSPFIMNPFRFAAAGGGGVGGWVELGRTTLGSASVDIDVTGLADKRYYMYLIDAKFNDTNPRDLRMQTGNGSFDTGSNYADRISHNGGADGTNVSWTFATTLNSLGIAVPAFGVGYTSNKSDKEKLFQHHFVHQNTAGAGNAAARNECVWKWANTSNSLDRLKVTRTSTYQFSSGSEVVVLGWDPADTHTSNFWEELASVDLSGGASPTLDSGVFTAKKYIWFQFYCDSIASNGVIRCTFNSDTGSNYANRINYNGTEDASNVNTAYAILAGSTYTTPFFVNMFVINNSANEKLITGNTIQQGAAGAGNAPAQRIEVADKWANTSSQITSIQIINNAAANFGTSTYLKVWGSD